MRIIRVFPRRTKATPDDELAYIGPPPASELLFLPKADEVRVSVAFSWDIEKAKQIAAAWARFYPVRIGGPAFDDKGGDFTPGLYLKQGYTFTSRGCPNKCGFCLAWKREGGLRELPIQPGNIVLDNNLLACSRRHIDAVLAMLSKQRRGAEFTGGIEAARVEPWFVKALTEIRFRRLHLAYDRPAERKPVADALRMFHEAGHKHWKLSCYVLVGFEGDTVEAAGERCQFVKDNGGVPFPMYFEPPGTKHKKPVEWMNFVGKLLSKPGAAKKSVA